jgi:hypothetical protein
LTCRNYYAATVCCPREPGGGFAFRFDCRREPLQPIRIEFIADVRDT